MAAPQPTPVYRFLHIDNLEIYLRRGGLHAPNSTPNDGLRYRTIHNLEIQSARSARSIRCGPGGCIHDYVPFYFGYSSPMMLQLHTGRVKGYTEGQEPLIYLVASAQAIDSVGCGFVFSDGHGVARFTAWFDDLAELHRVDWDTVYLRYWADEVNDMDRQRRKQAEFLVHRFCDWQLIDKIAVINDTMKKRVEDILIRYASLGKPVEVRRDWFYD